MQSPRQTMAEGLQEVLRTQPETPEDAVLLRYVLVAEYAIPAGHGKVLAVKSGDVGGSALPSWDARGLLAEAQASVARQRPGPEQPQLGDDEDLPF